MPLWPAGATLPAARGRAVSFGLGAVSAGDSKLLAACIWFFLFGWWGFRVVAAKLRFAREAWPAPRSHRITWYQVAILPKVCARAPLVPQQFSLPHIYFDIHTVLLQCLCCLRLCFCWGVRWFSFGTVSSTSAARSLA
jgi:hypothetical protein